MTRPPMGPMGVLAPHAAEPGRPVGLPCGVRSGDVTEHEAVLWAKGDGPGRLVARLSAGAHVGHLLRGPLVDASSDFTARLDLTGLTAGRAYDAALWFEGPDGTRGEVGHLGFRTAPSHRRPTSLAWIAGTAPCAAVRRSNPDLVVDVGPALPSGPHAETVEDFRAGHRRRADDEQLRGLRADVPFVVVWDDPESHRGWLPDAVLDDERYTERRTDVLAARARRAWQEYQPMRGEDLRHRADGGFATDRVYRRIARGPMLDLFCLDLRRAPGVAVVGAEQVEWLVREASRSAARWKLLAADLDPAVEAEDLELERIRRGLHDHDVPGVCWITSSGDGVTVDSGQTAAFGHAAIATSGELTVSLHDADGSVVGRQRRA